MEQEKFGIKQVDRGEIKLQEVSTNSPSSKETFAVESSSAFSSCLKRTKMQTKHMAVYGSHPFEMKHIVSIFLFVIYSSRVLTGSEEAKVPQGKTVPR